MPIKIAMISDVHNKWHHLQIPECDILISAGDYSFVGEQSIVREFHKWLNQQPAKEKISVQGNHEVWVQRNWHLAKCIAQEQCPGVHFIDEGRVELLGKKIWCSAITPWFHDWAWNRQRGLEIRKHWERIPIDTEILVTHGPPYGILDQVKDEKSGIMSEPLGCKDLRAQLGYHDDIKLHVFGHIHTGSGEMDFGGIHFVNASIVDEQYRPCYPVRVFDLP